MLILLTFSLVHFSRSHEAIERSARYKKKGMVFAKLEIVSKEGVEEHCSFNEYDPVFENICVVL